MKPRRRWRHDRQCPFHRRLRSKRRRRHPGRPEDVLRTRRLRHGGDHRADGAEHAGRAIISDRRSGICRRTDRCDLRRRAGGCGEDRHGGDRGDCGSDRGPAAPSCGAQHRARSGDGGEERPSSAARGRGRGTARHARADGAGDHAEPAGGRRAARRTRSRRRLPTCSGRCAICIGSARSGCCSRAGISPDEDSTDLLFDGETITELPGRRIDTRNTHGTGCTLSAAIAALLPRFDMVEAVRRAKAYLTACDRRERPTDGWQRPRAGASLPRTLDGGHGAMTQFSEAAWQRTAALRKAIDELPFNTELAAGTTEPRALPGLHRAGRAVSGAVFAHPGDRRREGTRCGNAARVRLMRAGGGRRRAGAA